MLWGSRLTGPTKTRRNSGATWNCTKCSPLASLRVRRGRAAASGPFVDRVALLLDPSLMEQARRAAGKFQLEINAAADRVLRKVFSRRRVN